MTQSSNCLPVTFSGLVALREFLKNYNGSWRQLVWEFRGRVSVSTLRRIAGGHYTPKRREVIRALHLPETAIVSVCPRHGVVHKGRCPRRTFEENAASYDDWKHENAAQLAALMEGKPL